jgi:hypothetical protein
MLAAGSSENPGEVRRIRLKEGDLVEAYRLVHAPDVGEYFQLVEDLRSNAAKGTRPRGRAMQQFVVHCGVSVFKTAQQAVERRRRIVDRLQQSGGEQQLRIGDYVARLEVSGSCYWIEDLADPTGHLTIWGDPFMLADAVTDIYPASTPDR